MRKRKFYRAFMVTGFVDGGGGSQWGEWRKSYKAALNDLVKPAYQCGYSDTVKGIEVREEL